MRMGSPVVSSTPEVLGERRCSPVRACSSKHCWITLRRETQSTISSPGFLPSLERTLSRFWSVARLRRSLTRREGSPPDRGSRTGRHCRPLTSSVASESPALKVGERLFELPPRAHDEGAVARDGLAQRPSRDQERPRGLAIGTGPDARDAD